MSKKMGRPKLENPNVIHTSVRLDAKTDEELSRYCESHNISRGEAVRKGVKLLLSSEKE